MKLSLSLVPPLLFASGSVRYHASRFERTRLEFESNTADWLTRWLASVR